ncbi:MAG: ABC transporter substrate-binding protein, partial [Acetobacteraceae bacterium]|nr:ABC transporter substrate-binding protein [Acetobacteraceae bacterium]
MNKLGLTRRHALAAGAALVLQPRFATAQTASAQAGRDPAMPDELVKAAQREGTINYYHNSDIDTTAKWTAAFTQQFGVPTKNMRMPSYPLYDRWLNEERVGRHVADLVQITDPTLLSAAAKQGFVANYKPASGATIDPTLREDGIWYALTLDLMGIGYNAHKVTPDEEKFIRDAGYEALADSRWKGRFGTATPASGGSSYAWCYMFLDDLKDRYGETWFRKLAANKPDIYASKAPLFERLAAGEYAIMDQGSQGSLTDMYLKGAPVRWTFPAPTPVAVTVQSISAHAPHPNAARLFQEWSVTAASEELWLGFV